MVIAAGGDGTINAVATALAGSDAVLGVLPLGTLNHFARDMGLPLDLDQALLAIAQGYSRPVDVAEVNGRIFLNNAALGMYPGIVALRERRLRYQQLKRWRRLSKILVLGWATAKVLADYRVLTIHLDLEGRQLVRTTPIVFVGNNRYVSEGLQVGRRARLDEGTLYLVIPHHQGPAALLWSALRQVLRLRDRDGAFEQVVTRELRIASPHRHLDVTVDGELLRLATPLHYRSRPGALRVAVPAPAD